MLSSDEQGGFSTLAELLVVAFNDLFLLVTVEFVLLDDVASGSFVSFGILRNTVFI